MSGAPVVAGVILAGGRGERLGGVVKASLRVGGEPLLDHVAARLAPHLGLVLVATGHIAHRHFRGAGPLVLVPDAEGAQEGPVGGLREALAAISRLDVSCELLVSVAVDTPDLPGDYVPRMIEAARRADKTVVACWGEQDYPTNAAWRVAALEEALSQPPGSRGRGLRTLLAPDAVSRLDFARPGMPDPFRSINTVADLRNFVHSKLTVSHRPSLPEQPIQGLASAAKRGTRTQPVLQAPGDPR